MLFGNQGETVELLSEDPVRNRFGAVIGWTVEKAIPNCVVSPAGDQVVRGEGFVQGDLQKLQVLAPAGTVLEEGRQVKIRGEVFRVEFAPFDYSHGRRPALGRHRPRVLFTVVRGDAHDHG